MPDRSNLDVFLVACEPSADVLGAELMGALRAMQGSSITFRGLGGPGMSQAGLVNRGSIDELTKVGIASVVVNLPTILRRLNETVEMIVAHPPDVLILIDAPDFTHRVAARVRSRLPKLPIVKYVSPTVWIWRPGRARAMRRSIDLILALLPFEPAVHRELGGPACVYVGHPLLTRLRDLRPSANETDMRAADPPLVLVLPGSRPSEIRRLSGIFGDTLGRVADRRGIFEAVLPTLPQLAAEIAGLTENWPVHPLIVTSEADKCAAFRRARAALAASGTVTLELALAGVPSVAAYRIPPLEGFVLRFMARVHPAVGVRSVILANLVLGDFIVPEYLQNRCTAANLAPALAELLGDTPARRRQVEAFHKLEGILDCGVDTPSTRAARAVLDLLAAHRLREMGV
ncbi:MAG TPA: lipid-A-disaccharide synthase [Xanthobacteraceae bacterium]|jgi:lipid-A-disaccharide synthase